MHKLSITERLALAAKTTAKREKRKKEGRLIDNDKLAIDHTKLMCKWDKALSAWDRYTLREDFIDTPNDSRQVSDVRGALRPILRLAKVSGNELDIASFMVLSLSKQRLFNLYCTFVVCNNILRKRWLGQLFGAGLITHKNMKRVYLINLIHTQVLQQGKKSASHAFFVLNCLLYFHHPLDYTRHVGITLDTDDEVSDGEESSRRPRRKKQKKKGTDNLHTLLNGGEEEEKEDEEEGGTGPGSTANEEGYLPADLGLETSGDESDVNLNIDNVD